MPNARTWTEAADSLIREMRADRLTWAEIGRSLGLSRNTVIERGRRILAVAPPKLPRLMLDKLVSDDPNRGPLPAGHALTWGLLTDEVFPTYSTDR
jgi:hypothetical protein